MRNCKIYLTFFFLAGFILARSQDSYFTRNYIIDHSLINPAVTGSDWFPKLVLSSEKQFLGIDDSPNTYFISGQMRVGAFDFYDPRQFLNNSKFKSLDRVGLGGGIYYDNDGPLSQLMLNLSYAYHVPVGKKSELSFGLLGSMINYKLNSEDLKPNDIDDIVLYDNREENISFNSDFGVYFSNPNYFAGISAKNLLTTNEGIDNKVSSLPNFYLIGGYRFSKNPLVFIFEPSITAKREVITEKFVIDIHSKFYFGGYNWFLISYRDFQLLNIRFAVKAYKTFYVGYSFEYLTNSIGNYNYGTHGVMCGMNLGLRKPQAIIE